MHRTLLEVKVVTQNKDKCLEEDICTSWKRNVKIKTSVYERVLIKFEKKNVKIKSWLTYRGPRPGPRLEDGLGLTGVNGGGMNQ